MALNESVRNHRTLSFIFVRQPGLFRQPIPTADAIDILPYQI